jgi:SNF2 family DNA or RNA helicase
MLRMILKAHKNDQILIFTNFKKTIEFLSSVVNNSVGIHGGLEETKKMSIINEFKTNTKQTLIGTTKLIGVSQNFQNANVVIFWDNNYSTLQKIQAEGRVLRVGQKKQCFIYNLYYKDSIEEKVLNRVSEKRKDFEEIMKIIELK